MTAVAEPDLERFGWLPGERGEDLQHPDGVHIGRFVLLAAVYGVGRVAECEHRPGERGERVVVEPVHAGRRGHRAAQLLPPGHRSILSAAWIRHQATHRNANATPAAATASA